MIEKYSQIKHKEQEKIDEFEKIRLQNIKETIAGNSETKFLLEVYQSMRKAMEYGLSDRDLLKDVDGFRRSIHNTLGDYLVHKKLSNDREEGRQQIIKIYFSNKKEVTIPTKRDYFYQPEIFSSLSKLNESMIDNKQ